MYVSDPNAMPKNQDMHLSTLTGLTMLHTSISILIDVRQDGKRTPDRHFQSNLRRGDPVKYERRELL